METRVMDADSCDIAHETLLLKEFREAKLEAGRSARAKPLPRQRK